MSEPGLGRIAFLSAVILFVEMLLVRWVGTEVRIFAYLQNGVLVACFLGLGLGCRNARVPARLLPVAVGLLSIALVIRDPLGLRIGETLTQGLVAFQDSVTWGQTLAQGAQANLRLRLALIAVALIATLGLLYAIALVFHPLGQWLGRWIDAFPRPIAAYSANILGSLIGIALFDALTILSTPPWLWLLVGGVGLVLLAPAAADRPWVRALSCVTLLALPAVAWTPGGAPTVWSPYQKLALRPLETSAAPSGRRVVCGEQIDVNNTGYQLILDLDRGRMAASPATHPPGEIRMSHYVLPYEIVGPREHVLVVGAGAGNDVAAGLIAGARAVHAVEIDPVIAALGRARHPNGPYASDQVRLTIDDARAFFRRDGERYDLVWFGLLDSHTTPSAYTNVRLDHFVYTRESLADVRRLLAPTGVVVLLFEPQTPWIADRLVRLLRDTFATAPLALEVRSSSQCLGWGGLLLIAGSEQALAPVHQRVQQDSEIRARLLDAATFPLTTPPTTDDWPYLYLRGPSIPTYHLLVGLLCLVFGLVFVRRQISLRGEGLDLPMLLLGAGFMLLEVSGVSRAALLYGTTWTVNAFVVGAILVMVLLANLVASRTRIDPSGWPLVGLAVSLTALALVPTAWLASGSLPLRILLGSAFLALPVFFSGLVFVTCWAAGPRRDLALGSNILGALLGGIASMLSMVVGFRLLGLLTLAVYALAFVAMRRPRS